MKEPGEMRMGKGKEGNMKGDWRTAVMPQCQLSTEGRESLNGINY